MRQLCGFVGCCALTPAWEELKAVNGGYVDLYQMNKHFVKPWTRGTGNSVALLMNNQAPQEAQLMVSHVRAPSGVR